MRRTLYFRRQAREAVCVCVWSPAESTHVNVYAGSRERHVVWSERGEVAEELSGVSVPLDGVEGLLAQVELADERGGLAGGDEGRRLEPRDAEGRATDQGGSCEGRSQRVSAETMEGRRRWRC